MQQQKYQKQQEQYQYTKEQYLISDNETTKQPENFMANPNMPGDNVLKFQGQHTLETMNAVHSFRGNNHSCGDITQYCPAPTLLNFKTSLQNPGNDFTIEFTFLTPIHQEVKGEINYLDQKTQQSVKMYDVIHQRPCFCCKCFCLYTQIGCLIWNCFHICYPSTSKLIKNNKMVKQFKYSRCARSVIILDDQNVIQYQLKRNDKCCDPCRYLYDQYDNQIEGFEMNIEYIPCTCRFQQSKAHIRFPNHMSQDDKAAIMFALMRFN